MSRLMTPKQWQHFCYYTMGWRDAAIRQGYETDTDNDDDPPTRTYRRVVREGKPDCGLCINCKSKFRYGGNGKRKKACSARRIVSPCASGAPAPPVAQSVSF